MKILTIWKYLKENNNKINIEIFILTFAVSLFIFRTAIPFLKYPFVIVYSISIIYFLINYNRVWKSSLKSFISHYSLILFIVLILFLAILFSNKLYLIAVKDLFNTLIAISVFFFYSLIVNTGKKLNFFFNTFIYISILFAILISILDLFGNSLSIDFLVGSNTRIDYNFATIPIFIGLIGLLFKIPKENRKYRITALNILLIIFIFSIALSKSRRGFILVLLIIIVLGIATLSSYLKRNFILSKLGNKIRYTFIFIFILGSLIYIFASYTSTSFKNNFLRSMELEDIEHSKENLTVKLYRFVTIFNDSFTFTEYYDDLWPVNFDPCDPESGWGTRVHKTVFPLTGLNDRDIPNETKGYLMDHTCNASTWQGNAFSYTSIGNNGVQEGDIVSASVYCYVSKDFDGNWVRLSSKGETYGNTTNYYDLKNKGTWQKLNIRVTSKKGSAPVYLFFSKHNVTDFSSLKGHVIFAYPQYEILHIKENPSDPDSGWGTRIHKTVYPLSGNNVEIVPNGAKGYLMDSTCNADSWGGNAYSYTTIGSDSLKQGDKVLSSVYCYISKDFNGDWAKIQISGSASNKINQYYNIDNKGIWQKLNLNIKCNTGTAQVRIWFAKNDITKFSSLKGYVIFAYPEFKVIRKDSLQSYNLPQENDLKLAGIRVGNDWEEGQKKTIYDSLVREVQKIKKIQGVAFSKKVNIYQSGIFNFSLPSIKLIDTTQIDSDPVRNWITKLVAEDTTYYPYKTNIKVDSVYNIFIAPRTMRWQFALQIFIKEYNWKQKIFGNGFDFLNWYGFYFLDDKTKSDYPHNPFLTVLLYSGIIGLLLYLVLLYKVFYYYIKYIKKYYILFIFFLITFYFSFFSSISPFNPPVTSFFIMLPFLIHAVHERDLENRNN